MCPASFTSPSLIGASKRTGKPTSPRSGRVAAEVKLASEAKHVSPADEAPGEDESHALRAQRAGDATPQSTVRSA